MLRPASQAEQAVRLGGFCLAAIGQFYCVMQQTIGISCGGFTETDVAFADQGYAFLVKKHLGLVMRDVAAIGTVVDENIFAAIAFDFTMLT